MDGSSDNNNQNNPDDPFGLAGIPGIDSPVPSHQNADALNDLPGVFDSESAAAPAVTSDVGSENAAPGASGGTALAMPAPPDLGGGGAPSPDPSADPYALPPSLYPASPGAPSTATAPGAPSAATAPGAPAAAAAPTPAGTTAPASDAMGKIKEFSEKMGATPAAVAAAFPFSLMIEGHLDDYEREKLTDILSRENMGILESDLVPQFASDRILLPRISEYAGTLIIQSLRSAQVRMRLGPSDEIFATDETRTGPGELGLSETSHTADNVMYATPGGGSGHPAENIPLTDESKMPGLTNYTVVDVLTASALLQTTQVEAQRSTEYQEILEGLQREIKYKAYHKGATAVLRFAVQLVPLILPTSYRLMVTGLAVRDKRASVERDQ